MALLNAMRASRRGDSHTVQRMFRARVAAQAFTVVAMMAGGLYYSKDRQRTAELRKVQQARDAEEKRIRWIKELEVRDEEEKERVRALDAKKAARRTEKLGAASGEEEKGIVAAAVAAATPPSPAAAPKEGLSGGLISGLVGKTKASDGGGKGEGPA
jgi:microsomal dipeptidase-like Zn-dependent dipeptidase